MSIEPANASKSLIRETPSPVPSGASASPDGLFSSIWEKSVRGAQKLFGADRSDASESDDRRDEDEAKARAAGAESGHAYASASALASRPVFGGSAFSSIRLTRPSEDAASLREPSAAEPADSDLRVGEAPEPSASDESEELPEEETVDRAPSKRLAQQPDAVRTAPAVARAEPAIQSLPAESVSPTPPVAAPRETEAPPASVTTSRQAADEIVSTSFGQPAPARALAEPAPQPSAGAQPIQSPNTAPASPVRAQPATEAASRPVSTPAAETSAAKLAKPATELPTQPSEAAKPSAPAVAQSNAPVPEAKPQPQASAATTAQPAAVERLAIDPDKAMAAVSESLPAQSDLAKPSAPVQAAAAPATERVVRREAPAAHEPAKAPAAETVSAEQLAEAPKAAPTEAKPTAPRPAAPAHSASTEGAKPSVSQPSQASVADSAPKQGAAVEEPIQTHFKGAELPVVSLRAQAPSSPAPQAQPASSNAAAGALAGANGLAAGSGAGGAAGSHSGGAGSEGEQKAAVAGTSSASAAASKGADKSGSDGVQAFDAKLAGAEGSRKSQAAAKAQTTSYVAKTADQIKEVYAALSRSIDSLAGGKPGEMNLRIDFQQGGSLTMKVSMEGSQVTTRMQTDLPGLEGMIKANWGELAADWGAKGVKLVVPQFQQSAPSESLSGSDAWAGSDAREGRSGSPHAGLAGEGSASRGRPGSGRSARGAAATAPAAGNVSAPSANIANERELKAYA